MRARRQYGEAAGHADGADGRDVGYPGAPRYPRAPGGKEKIATSQAIDAHKTSEVVDQEWVRWRADNIARILTIVTDELDQLTRKESDEQYE